jgi:hypothetical protein
MRIEQEILVDSRLRHGQPPFFPNPDTFIQTIDSLLSGSAEGGGKRRDDITQTKLSVIDLAWDLFEEIGIAPAVTNTGSPYSERDSARKLPLLRGYGARDTRHPSKNPSTKRLGQNAF